MNVDQLKYRRILRRLLSSQSFNLTDVRSLAFDLGAAWDDLRGETQNEKVQALIQYLALRGRLQELVEVGKEERPDLNWPHIPHATQQIDDEKNNLPDREREAALQKYLRDMARLVERKSHNAASIATVQAFTDAAWPFLDVRRKNIVVQLLDGAELLNKIIHRKRDLREVNLNDVDLGQTDLTGAMFGRASLRNADLSEAVFSDELSSDVKLFLASRNQIAQFVHGKPILSDLGSVHADLTESDLSGANLNLARLSRVSLKEANLRGSNLSKADLSWADLEQAKLIGSDLRGADLSGANLNGANLSGIVLSQGGLGAFSLFGDDHEIEFFTKTVFTSAKYNAKTILPKGFNPADHGMILDQSS